MKEKIGFLYIYIIILLTAIFLCIAIPAKKVQAASVDWNVIALDPGHGGEEDGAYYYGKKEKDINYAPPPKGLNHRKPRERKRIICVWNDYTGFYGKAR